MTSQAPATTNSCTRSTTPRTGTPNIRPTTSATVINAAMPNDSTPMTPATVMSPRNNQLTVVARACSVIAELLVMGCVVLGNLRLHGMVDFSRVIHTRILELVEPFIDHGLQCFTPMLTLSRGEMGNHVPRSFGFLQAHGVPLVPPATELRHQRLAGVLADA